MSITAVLQIALNNIKILLQIFMVVTPVCFLDKQKNI